MADHSFDRNQEATCYIGDLDTQVTEALLWELCVQCGPVVNVHVPKDKLTQMHMGFGFVEFKGEEDAQYAIKVLNMVKMFGKPIRVNQAARDQQVLEVGANIFVGNLDAEVDEKLLYDTFSAFGVIVTTPKIMRDGETGNSRGFGFVSFESFRRRTRRSRRWPVPLQPPGLVHLRHRRTLGGATAPPPSGCSRRTTTKSDARPNHSSGWGPPAHGRAAADGRGRCRRRRPACRRRRRGCRRPRARCRRRPRGCAAARLNAAAAHGMPAAGNAPPGAAAAWNASPARLRPAQQPPPGFAPPGMPPPPYGMPPPPGFAPPPGFGPPPGMPRRPARAARRDPAAARRRAAAAAAARPPPPPDDRRRRPAELCCRDRGELPRNIHFNFLVSLTPPADCRGRSHSIWTTIQKWRASVREDCARDKSNGKPARMRSLGRRCVGRYSNTHAI